MFNVVVQLIVFLTLSTLICRGTDISKCFRESLGIRDNESRLYKAQKQVQIATGVQKFDCVKNCDQICYFSHTLLVSNVSP